MPFRRLAVALFALVVLTSTTAHAQDPVYDASGSPYGRGFFAPLPFERIDVVTGNLMLSFTDLVLPGNAGTSLAFVRTYNSRDGQWRFGIGGVPLRVVFNAIDLSDVDFITPDGGKHNAEGTSATTMTQGFWVFTKATRKLEMPNGLVLTYGHEPSSAGAYLTEIRDPFDNTVTLSWQSGTDTLQSVTQNLGGGQSRTITFSGWAAERAASMTYDGRTWTYDWQTISGTPSAISLTKVTPPAGGWWQFSYTNDSTGAVKMSSLTTVNGGTVTYTWATATFPTTPSSRVAVKTRTTGGRAPVATWQFDWSNAGRTLVIAGPVNRVIYDTVVVDDIPVASTRTITDYSPTTLETETITYETLPNPVADVPAPKTVTIVRDGRTFTTTYTYDSANWANYGQPIQVVESSALTRTTAITYNHGFSKYIRGRVASVTSTVNSQSSVRSFSYNSTTGFLQSATAAGVTTTFQANGVGNTESATDALSRRTDYTYSWGSVSSISSPHWATSVSRSINADGTVATESISGGATTTYGYDAAGRVTSVSTNTPGQTPVTTTFNVTSGVWTSTTTTRGSIWQTTTLDGWGRAEHTVDSTSVQSRVAYDGAGRKTYSSRAYGGGVSEVGTTYTYDPLGRPTAATRHDSTGQTWNYGSLAVWGYVDIQEQVSVSVYRNTRQYLDGFGSPGDVRMPRFVDAAMGDWRYEYNHLGQLTEVYKHSDSTVPLRTWTYDTNGRLLSQVQPESGTTTFQYDAVGNLTQTQDARGVTVTYQYDNLNRVTFVDALGTDDDVTTTYDLAGRVAAVTSAVVQSAFTYDIGGRMTSRTDVIAGRYFVQSFTYNGHDSLIQIDYPLSGRKVFYDYDAQQRLTAVRTQVGSGSVTTLANTFVYRGDGSLASYAFGNGQVASTTVDSRKRPLNWVNGPLDITYAYDYVNNVTSITDARGGGYSSQFTYDVLDRLTAVTGYGATSYTYTASGDRLTAGTINFHYNANHQLSSLSGSASGSFGYDAGGSLLTDPSGAAYSYTAHNKMKTANVGGQVTHYAYGGDGRRAVKFGPDNVPHLFVYGAGDGPIAEYQVIGGEVRLVREYVYVGGQLLASFQPEEVDLPPMWVTLVTPTEGATVGDGQQVTLTATAGTDGSVTIARVEYYVRGLLLGSSTVAPYTKTWTNTPLPPGFYVFHARVVATNGQAVPSVPVGITVQ